MPTYTYRCRECDHEFDVRQRMSDDPLTECPVCGGLVRRVVRSVGIVFKGSGFYVTDNRSSSNGRGGRTKTAEKPTSREGQSESAGREGVAKSESGSSSASTAKKGK